MQKVYQRINWENDPSTKSPINDDNLNKMDYALNEIDDRVVNLSGYETRVAESEANTKVSETNAKSSEINAKESEVKAKQYMEQAFSGTPEGYQELVDKVDRFDIKTVKENTIKNTKHGGFRLTKMLANTIQNGTPSPSTPFPLLSTGDCVEFIQGWMDSNGVYQPNYDYVIISKNKIPCKSGDVLKIKTENAYTYFSFYFFLGNTFVKQDYNVAVTGGVKEHSVTVPNGVDSFYCSIQKGSTAGINALSPDTVGKITITINGKYLGCARIRNENMYGGLKFANDLKNSGATVLEYTDEYITLSANEVTNKFAYYGNFKENTRYTFFTRGYNNADGYTTSTNLTIYYTDGTYTMLTFNSDRNCQNVQVSDEGKTIYFITGSWHAGLAYIYYDDFGIMEGVRTLEDFVPYKESIAWYTTQYPMIKGSTLFRENGLVKAMHYAREVVFDISRIGSIDNSIGLYQLLHNMTDLEPIACTHFVKYPYQDITFNSQASALSDGQLSKRYGDTQDRIYFRYSGFKSIDDVSAYLQTNSIVILCKTNTPIIETLDTASQIALNGVETFDGITHVEFDTRVQPLEFEAEVGTSQVGAYTLKALNNSESNAVRMDELAVAMVSL